MTKKFKVIVTNKSSKKRIIWNGISFEPLNSRVFSATRDDSRMIVATLNRYPELKALTKILIGNDKDIISFDDLKAKFQPIKSIEVDDKEKDVVDNVVDNKEIEDEEDLFDDPDTDMQPVKPKKNKKKKKNKKESSDNIESDK